MAKVFSGPYEILDQQCNGTQISNLLRKFKGVSKDHEAEIRVTADSKSDLVKHVRRVVSKELVPFDELTELIRRCEENGKQHIFLFKPARNSGLMADPVSIASLLFPEMNIEEELPSFERPKNAYKLVDFRTGFNNKKKDWILKAYGHHEVMSYVGKEEKTTANTVEVTRTYSKVDYSPVLIGRFNSPKLFELRIDSTGSSDGKNVLSDRSRAFWALCTGVLSQGDFEVFSLKSAITTMLADLGNKNRMYAFGDCQLKNSDGGIVKFHPDDDEESRKTLEMDDGRKEAIDALLSNSASGEYAVVYWKVGEIFPKLYSDKKATLRTVVTGKQTNELVVSSKVDGKVLDYVTSELRKFAR